jgi:hypothetical protein
MQMSDEDCGHAGGDFMEGVPCDPDPCRPVPTRAATWGSIKASFR